MTFAKRQAPIAIVCLFAFVMSGLVSERVFERLPHLEDELAYLWQAKGYAAGHLTISTPEPRRAYWQPFVVDYPAPIYRAALTVSNDPRTFWRPFRVDRDWRRFGKYTPGWSAQLALGVLMGQAWFVNAAFAALAVALVYRLGASVFNRDVGRIAALLVTFSPMALLLNGSLMGHSAAFAAALVFLWACWRIDQMPRRRWAWALLGGAALGLLAANRALTAAAFALPVAALFLRRIMQLQRTQRAKETIEPQSAQRTQRILSPFFASFAVQKVLPYVIMGLAAGVIALSVPIYNAAATGDPTTNLYTLVWEYDRVGFGEGAGRNVHTLEKGVRHARYDLSLLAADLFGWQMGGFTPDVIAHLQNEADYYPNLGVSWLLLPLGLVAAFRRSAPLAMAWIALGVGWLALPFLSGDTALIRDPRQAWLTIGGLMAFLLLPIFFWRDARRLWAWLLIAASLGLIVLQMTYWIGSQRYSTRYYYEALVGLALLSALPLAWLAQRGKLARWAVYGGLVVVCIISLYAYSTPRLMALYRYNFINPEIIAGVEARRIDDRPVLVLVNGETARWRSYGALMSLTSPLLDSEIVAAWNYAPNDPTVRAAILARFPDRQVIEITAVDNQASFEDG